MFKVDTMGWSGGLHFDVKAGTKAIMSPWDESDPFLTTVEIIPGPYTYPQGGHVTVDVRDEAIEDLLEPLEDNWGPSPGAMRRHRLPSSQRSRLKPNIAPYSLSVPPPALEPSRPWSSHSWRRWMAQTFAPGTPVKLTGGWLLDRYMQRLSPPVPKGARAVVAVDTNDRGHSRHVMWGDGWRVFVEVVDARDDHGMPIGEVIGQRGWMAVEPYQSGWYGAEPLEDAWGHAPGPVGRHRLPSSQRSRMKPNIPIDDLRVPEPDRSTTSVKDYVEWIETTFAPGTPVKIIGSDEYLRNAPVGARAKVLRVAGMGNVWVQFTDARDEIGLPLPYVIGATGVSHRPDLQLEPLEDNWLARFRDQTTGRHRLPASQRATLRRNSVIDELDIEVGDTLELERHPVYDHPGDVPSYKVTKRKVKRVSGNLLYLQGVRVRGMSGWLDKPMRVSGSKERGYWLRSGPPRPLRYAILSVTKGKRRRGA